MPPLYEPCVIKTEHLRKRKNIPPLRLQSRRRPSPADDRIPVRRTLTQGPAVRVGQGVHVRGEMSVWGELPLVHVLLGGVPEAPRVPLVKDGRRRCYPVDPGRALRRHLLVQRFRNEVGGLAVLAGKELLARGPRVF